MKKGTIVKAVAVVAATAVFPILGLIGQGFEAGLASLKAIAGT